MWNAVLGKKKYGGKKGIHFPGPVLSASWMDKQATKQAVQLRKKDVVKAGERNK